MQHLVGQGASSPFPHRAVPYLPGGGDWVTSRSILSSRVQWGMPPIESLDPKLAALLTTWIGVVGPMVKSMIDLIGIGTDLPKWAKPAIAVAGGQLGSFLMVMVWAVPITSQIIGLAIMAGWWAAIHAVGITEMQTRAEQAKVARKRG